MTEPMESSALVNLTLQHYPEALRSDRRLARRYRKITPRARLIPLTAPFLDYLRADGIILPPDDEVSRRDWSDDSGIFSSTEDQDADGDGDGDRDGYDPSRQWPDVHSAVRQTIAELGGQVCPKLNWSAPKDATWINATNTMDCRSPSDVYTMLKSSDFITHDLEQAFADTDNEPAAVDGDRAISSVADIPYHLVLRKFFMINPSVEFRCFVRDRRLLAITQRDPNHYEFLASIIDRLRKAIQALFERHLRGSFPDPNFSFDVYVPPEYDKAWLIDINPWAQRTDPILFSWLELLTMRGAEHFEATMNKEKMQQEEEGYSGLMPQPATMELVADVNDEDAVEATVLGSDDEAEKEVWLPELRLVKSNDPEAYSFASPAYSAHKLPKDVVDASGAGEGGMRAFAEEWRHVLDADKRCSSPEDDT